MGIRAQDHAKRGAFTMYVRVITHCMWLCTIVCMTLCVTLGECRVLTQRCWQVGCGSLVVYAAQIVHEGVSTGGDR